MSQLSVIIITGKYSVSLTPSCSSLLCSHGLHANSFCLALHMDMLTIRGILLAVWILQKHPLPEGASPKEIREVCQNNDDCLQKICRNLMTRLTSTDQVKRSFTAFPRPVGVQTPAVVSYLLPLPFPLPLTWKKPELCAVLKRIWGTTSLPSSRLVPPWSIKLFLLQTLTFWVLAFWRIRPMDFAPVTLSTQLLILIL